MQEFVLFVSSILVALYIVIDLWVVTPKYFVPLYIAVSIVILGLTLKIVALFIPSVGP
ncbi:MAG: hypothetical protein L0Y56_00210 [Nitrospira sp.]|nr:hypothetical protein [Nitrospira sp.]